MLILFGQLSKNALKTEAILKSKEIKKKFITTIIIARKSAVELWLKRKVGNYRDKMFGVLGNSGAHSNI